MRSEIERFEPQAGEGEFVFLHRIDDEIKARGFSIGSLQRDDPRGIMPANYDVAKWRNLSPADRRELHGVMTFVGSPRKPTAIIVTWRVTP